MLVRRIDIADVDIATYQFDFDLVFAVMFMNANENIYGRYGSRGPWSSGSRISLAGLKYTMNQILRAHDQQLEPEQPRPAPQLARDLRGRRGCMHCHQVWEDQRANAKESGTFDPESVFVYPLPENIGLRLDVDQGNRVVRIKENSACSKVDLKTGDLIQGIGPPPYLFSSRRDLGIAQRAPRGSDIDSIPTRRERE